MDDTRLEQFRQLVAEFPESPMGHFSLGKAYIERRAYEEAVRSLEEAVRLDREYAAAMVALGDAYAGAGLHQKAREVLERARATALAQSHPSLAEEIAERLQDMG